MIRREIDPVVGHAVLREVIGADAFGAVAGADQALALGRTLGPLLLDHGVVDAHADHSPAVGLVLVLAAFGAALGDDAGGDVCEPHAALRLVLVLPAGAARGEGVRADVLFADLDLHFARLGHDGDGGGGGVNAALLLRLRHTLHAMAARLEAQLPIHSIAGDAEADFLEPAAV